ncbi:MAG TPA: sigma-70 family RNA polymerase sigma factor [Dehalococcoidia bacterium]|nr:sigma-70 family RNA polymerase sigma factor [Dehalococcoidia bacterium]
MPSDSPLPIRESESALASTGLRKRAWARREPNWGTNRVSSKRTAEPLLERIADGDDEALRDLYREYGRLAFSIAVRIVSREDLAEEIVQEAFLRVWRNADRFDHRKASFSTWFGHMVRNLCIDVLRRKDPLHRAGSLDGVSTWLAHSAEIESEIVDRVIVRESFLRLPADQSRVLEMAYFEGFTHREIAEALEIPEGTVKSRMRLGLKKMRDHLSEGKP